MRWYEKFLVVPLVISLGFTFGMSSTVIYAKHHHPVPGVDKPFDPANYWSEETISVPDSKPSKYALKDLAKNGGQVFDKKRHEKTLDAVKNYIRQIQMLLQQYGILHSKHLMFNAGTTAEMKNDLADISQAVYTGTTDVAFSDSPSSPFYHQPSGEGYYAIGPDPQGEKASAQSKYLEQKLQESDLYMERSKENSEAILNALSKAVNASSSAEGTNQIVQAGNQIQALKTLAKSQSNQMFREFEKMDALQKAAEEERTRTSQAAFAGKTTLHILDPKDPIDKKILDGYYKMTGVKPYESKPMPDFY